MIRLRHHPGRFRFATAAVVSALLLAGCASRTTTSSGSVAQAPAAAGAAAYPGTVYVAGDCPYTASNSLTPEPGAGARTAAPATTAKDGAPNYGGAGYGGGVIPPGFTPVSAFSCGMDEQAVPGDGTWRVATRKDTADGLSDLMAAYRAPVAPMSVPSGQPVSCTMELDLDPGIALVDAHGTAIYAAAPRDPLCHHITDRVRQAVAALKWKTTKTVRVQQDSSQGGCGNSWKDMLSVDTPKGPTTGVYFTNRPTTRLVLCVYDITPDGSGPGTLLVGTKLDKEVDLTGADLAAAVATMDAAPPAGACTQQPTKFAVMTGDGKDLDGYLELDGCRRFGGGNGGSGGPGLRQLTAEQVGQIVGVK